MAQVPRRILVLAGVLLLLDLFAVQFLLSAQRNSITWDEGHHLYSGYLSWKTRDFGINPEVPPYAKMIAAAPLLLMHLTVPPLQGRLFKDEAFFGGRDFMFGNDTDAMLLRARLAASIFSFALALLVFFAAQRMFSTEAAFLALALFVFDPNFLAHGALVTTDVASACSIFATVYAFYRWRMEPSRKRLVLVGLCAGLALVTKFTGILVAPILLLLAGFELAFPAFLSPYRDLIVDRRAVLFRRFALGLPIAGLIAWTMVWAMYGFRFAARPRGLVLHPAFADYVRQLSSPASIRILTWLDHHYFFPKSWLYGLADTKITADTYTSYFWGHVYPHGHLLYFPACFAIKSTLPFLLLFALAWILIAIRWFNARREILYLVLPAAVYFLVAMTSNMNIGARHLLPIYPFFYVLGAGAAAKLLLIDRRWLIAVIALVAWQAADAITIYPAYMAFGNGLWGGPSKVHLYLSDANVDWGQQLNDVRAYLASRGIVARGWNAAGRLPDRATQSRKQPHGSGAGATRRQRSLDAPPCWFAYFPDGVVLPSAYGIPCKRLPTADTLWWQHDPTSLPTEIDGPVLISDSDLAGIEFGEGPLNPYEQFRTLKPTAVIDYGVYVYDGRFAIPLAAALNDAEQANNLLKANQPAQALAFAQKAVVLAPNLVNPQVALGDALTALHRPAEARVCYANALSLAQRIEPQLQTAWIPVLKAKLAGK
ncbi:MAG TPA: glycosyltransferase family 39 protein [Acidobacteriaceae bacterium]|nr:glycosyltransferase family 39 protein [Acidobacteriaceae bacterium]